MNAAKKKWVLISAGAGALLLVIILVFISHSRAEVPVQVATAPPSAAASSQATSSQFDSEDYKPSPQRPAAAQNQIVPSAAAVNTPPTQTDSEQTDAEQADPTPGQNGPSSAQAAMMHEQLNAPSRISQQMQQQAPANAPPPSNFSAEGGMGGGGNIGNGNVFGGKAPSVVAAQHGPLAISAGVAMGLLTQKTAPLYPEIAKKARVSGTVQLEALISKAGRVENVRVLSGPVMLQGAALEAVRSWRYRPYIVDNQPTEVKTTVYVAFSLGN